MMDKSKKEREEDDPEEDFVIRTYGKGELALLYMDNVQQQTAVNCFNAWLHRCPGLEQRLSELGWRPEARKYTPAQVRVIIDALGEP